MTLTVEILLAILIAIVLSRLIWGVVLLIKAIRS